MLLFVGVLRVLQRTCHQSVNNQHILKTLSEKAELEAQRRDAFMKAAAEQEALQTKADAKQSLAAKEPKIKAVERISAQGVVTKVINAMKEAVLRTSQQIEVTTAEVNATIPEEEAELLADAKAKREDVVAAKVPADSAIEKIHADYTAVLEDEGKTGEELHEFINTVNVAFKAWNTATDTAHAAYKAKSKSYRTFLDLTKKALNDKAKAAAKKAVKEACPAEKVPASKLGLELIEAMTTQATELTKQKYVNVKWSIKDDLIDATEPAVVIVPSDRLGKLAESVKELDYYAQQKTWAEGVMSQHHLTQASTAIVKTNVPGTLMQVAVYDHHRPHHLAHLAPHSPMTL